MAHHSKKNETQRYSEDAYVWKWIKENVSVITTIVAVAATIFNLYISSQLSPLVKDVSVYASEVDNLKTAVVRIENKVDQLLLRK